jgi:hypothetical protein
MKITDPAYGYRDCITHLLDTPYEKNIYLDTDITLAADISDIYDLLCKFDLAAKHDPKRTERDNIPLPDVPAAFPEYNLGVIAYRKCEKMRQFVDRWLQLYDNRDSESIHDQPFFRKAAYETDIRLSTLPSEYNCQYAAHPGCVSGKVRVFHGRIIDDAVIGDRYKYDPSKVIQKLNATASPRVYIHNTRFQVITSERSLLNKIIRSLRQRGVYGTINKAISKFYTGRFE